MKKMRIALASMLVAAGITATAGAANFTNCADRLKDVGLFQGTNQGYQLDKAPTRAEASAMLVRLLGKEAEAEKLTYTAPFTDLKGWEKPYVQYLYDNGLANGMSATAYNPTGKCSAQMYTTFLLRALGYSDAKGDFTYAKALDFGEQVGLVDDINCSTKNFLRDNVVAMSLTALDTDVRAVTAFCSISWLQTVPLTRPRLLLWAHFSQTRTHSTPLRRTPRRSPRWLWI